MTRRSLVALALVGGLVAGLLYALAAGFTASTKPGETPSSRVFDEATGLPLPQAQAQVLVTRLTRSDRPRISPSGSFRILAKVGEPLRVEAVAPGYAPVGITTRAYAKGWTCELPLRPLEADSKALPSGQGGVSVDALGQARGWDLEGGKAAEATQDADLLPSVDLKGGVRTLLAVNGAKLLPVTIPEGRIPAWEFERMIWAPLEDAGWVATAEVRGPGQLFCVSTRHGRFARILLTGTGAEAAFRYVFQPDGSRHLGRLFEGKLGEGMP